MLNAMHELNFTKTFNIYDFNLNTLLYIWNAN